MPTSIYLDEAGDTGFTLDKPYLHGGSSRFIVLTAIVIPPEKNNLINRIPKGLYKRRGKHRNKELKSVHLSGQEKVNIARQFANLAMQNIGIEFHAIVSEKQNVPNSLQQHSESFYAHMAEQMLHSPFTKHAQIDFIPDARSLKNKDQYTLHNYLETRLAISGHAPTIITTPSESKHHLELQATDYLCSIVFNHFEFSDSQAFNTLGPQLIWNKLY